MAGNWNPFAPGAMGLEWFPLANALGQPATSPTRATVLRSTSAQTVTALRFGIGPTINQTNPEFLVCEIYPVGQYGVAVSQQPLVDYPPNADGAIGAWSTQSGGTTNLWQSIDDPVQLPPTDTNFIRTFSTSATAYFCHFATGAFPLTARVNRLKLRAVFGITGLSSGSRHFTIRLYYVPTGTIYLLPSASFNAGFYGVLADVDAGEINPVTLLPWTPQDIREFDGGDWQVRIESTASASLGASVQSVELRVRYTDPDPRVAVGTYQRAPGAPGPIISTDQLVELSGGVWVPNWSKPASGDFTFMLRQANARAVTVNAALASDIQWAHVRAEWMGQPNPPPVPGMQSFMLAWELGGSITAGVIDSQPHIVGRLDLMVGGVVADDSQPYRVDWDHATGIGTSRRDVTVGGTYIAQRFTPAANQSYLGVQFVTAPPPGGGDYVLEVSVRRVSDNALMGGVLQVTADQVIAGGAGSGNAPGFYSYEAFLSAGAALVSGTQYEIRFEPISGPSSVIPWGFMAARQDGSPSSNTAGFQGSGSGIIDDGVADNTYDIGAVLLLQPTAPANPRAEVIPVEQSGDGCFCTVKWIDEVLLTWEGTSLGVAFARYEIERMDDDAGLVWTPVAVTLSESVNPLLGTTLNRWPDYQAKRNRPVKYRIRVIATSGAFSAWAETDFVTPRSYGNEIIFTSNAKPGITLVYDRLPQMSLEDENNDSDERARIFGGYGHVTFSEPEDRGVSQAVTLIVNGGRLGLDDLERPIGGEEVFAPLRNIVRSMATPPDPIPYICVLDYKGNRKFARVQITGMGYENPGEIHLADIAILPLTLDNGVVVIP